ncbi:glutathione S-transferase family protein [Bradyrhizobium uaiense]|uniref:Glutathione S-transferase family protein n=1 Tax=Bradyrhizobium uaiense TaxID=2594946 RepID=A0A6P1BKD7_9BRAD|nr:glutathione S-transferase family protein [Bradyrhizobium uaiense]NEU98634.1 glutathione S-transferase family protein [Bradyrhizobium uaiense]
MLRLYDSLLSGNCWKARILLSQLNLEYERITLDLVRGDTQQPGFETISRFARVPVLVLEDGHPIVESGAILMHLAEGTRFLPVDLYERTEVLSWLFFEQADLQKAIAFPRVYNLRGQASQMKDEIAYRQKDGYGALQKLENWLGNRSWLVGNSYTIADTSVFAYVSLAAEGGYRMDRYPEILRWLDNVRSTEGWVPLIEKETTS